MSETRGVRSALSRASTRAVSASELRPELVTDGAPPTSGVVSRDGTEVGVGDVEVDLVVTGTLREGVRFGGPDFVAKEGGLNMDVLRVEPALSGLMRNALGSDG